MQSSFFGIFICLLYCLIFYCITSLINSLHPENTPNLFPGFTEEKLLVFLCKLYINRLEIIQGFTMILLR